MELEMLWILSSCGTNLTVDGDVLNVLNAAYLFQYASRLIEQASLWLCRGIFVYLRTLCGWLWGSRKPPSPSTEGCRASLTASLLDKENLYATCCCFSVSWLSWRPETGGRTWSQQPGYSPPLILELLFNPPSPQISNRWGQITDLRFEDRAGV